jgi:hypothetical protein
MIFLKISGYEGFERSNHQDLEISGHKDLEKDLYSFHR